MGEDVWRDVVAGRVSRGESVRMAEGGAAHSGSSTIASAVPATAPAPSVSTAAVRLAAGSRYVSLNAEATATLKPVISPTSRTITKVASARYFACDEGCGAGELSNGREARPEGMRGRHRRGREAAAGGLGRSLGAPAAYLVLAGGPELVDGIFGVDHKAVGGLGGGCSHA